MSKKLLIFFATVCLAVAGGLGADLYSGLKGLPWEKIATTLWNTPTQQSSLLGIVFMFGGLWQYFRVWGLKFETLTGRVNVLCFGSAIVGYLIPFTIAVLTGKPDSYLDEFKINSWTRGGMFVVVTAWIATAVVRAALVKPPSSQ